MPRIVCSKNELLITETCPFNLTYTVIPMTAPGWLSLSDGVSMAPTHFIVIGNGPEYKRANMLLQNLHANQPGIYEHDLITIMKRYPHVTMLAICAGGNRHLWVVQEDGLRHRHDFEENVELQLDYLGKPSVDCPPDWKTTGEITLTRQFITELAEQGKIPPVPLRGAVARGHSLLYPKAGVGTDRSGCAG